MFNAIPHRRFAVGFFRGLWLASAALAVSVAALVAGCATGPQAQPPVPRGDGPAFTVASFNVRCRTLRDAGELRWYRRMPRIAEIIRSRGFDLVGVQECVLDEAHILDDELTAFARVGCGRNADRGGEAMYIYYRKDRFEVLEDGTFWLSQTPDRPGSKYDGAGCPRTCTWALMKDRRTGRVFRYFNTHLDHVSPQARVNGMEVLLKRGVRPAKARGETILLTGDLNATLCGKDESPELVRALDGPVLAEKSKENPIALVSTELKDAYLTSETPHFGPYRTFHGFKGKPLFRIDYIFTTPNVRVLDHATYDDAPGGYASDHYPVAATVVIP